MEPAETQDMTVEESAASLGLATRLSEQFLMQQMAQERVMMGMEAKMPQGNEKTLRDEYSEQEVNNEKLDLVLDEIADIKKEIAEALENDDNDKENGRQE